MTNNCSYTVWPGILTNAGPAPPPTGGFALSPGQSRTVAVTNGWSGRIWGRTLCAQSFACATEAPTTAALAPSSAPAAAPATLAGFMLASGGGDDFYNVSLVDGYNVPMVVAPPNASCE